MFCGAIRHTYILSGVYSYFVGYIVVCKRYTFVWKGYTCDFVYAQDD